MYVFNDEIMSLTLLNITDLVTTASNVTRHIPFKITSIPTHHQMFSFLKKGVFPKIDRIIMKTIKH